MAAPLLVPAVPRAPRATKHLLENPPAPSEQKSVRASTCSTPSRCRLRRPTTHRPANARFAPRELGPTRLLRVVFSRPMGFTCLDRFPTQPSNCPVWNLPFDLYRPLAVSLFLQVISLTISPFSPPLRAGFLACLNHGPAPRATRAPPRLPFLPRTGMLRALALPDFRPHPDRSSFSRRASPPSEGR